MADGDMESAQKSIFKLKTAMNKSTVTSENSRLFKKAEFKIKKVEIHAPFTEEILTFDPTRTVQPNFEQDILTNPSNTLTNSGRKSLGIKPEIDQYFDLQNLPFDRFFTSRNGFNDHHKLSNEQLCYDNHCKIINGYGHKVESILGYRTIELHGREITENSLESEQVCHTTLPFYFI